MGKRKQSGRAGPQATIKSAAQPQTARPWYRRLGWWWAAIVASTTVAWALLTNSAAVLQNLRDTPESFRETEAQFQSWLHEDEEWTGNWSSNPEGVVDTASMGLSDTDLQVTLWATGGELDGTIATRRICEAMPFANILLRGEVSGDQATVIAWDYVGGREVQLATLNFAREGSVMTVTPTEGNAGWFVERARIGRHPREEGQEPKPNMSYCSTILQSQPVKSQSKR